MNPPSFASLKLTLLAALALFVMGCAATASVGSIPSIFFVVAALAFGGLGCFISSGEDSDPPTTLNNINEPRDMGSDQAPSDLGAGQWETCCDNGQISQCFCPEGAECNYGWFTACDPAQSPVVECALFEEQCGYGEQPDMGPDADMGKGQWEACCQNGKISQCFCPEGAACNYGWFTTCDPQTSEGGIECAPPVEDACGDEDKDMGPVEPDMAEDMGKGQWEACCQDGQISQCFCPEGVACNYGWFTTCDPAQSPAVQCAFGEEQCGYGEEPDMGDDAGMGGVWQPCCENGQISQCFCPDGVACNYGLVTCDPAVSGVACVPPRAQCPVTM